MREFFRGWRRKCGVVTLVMALGIMALWVRSFRFVEGFEYDCTGNERCSVTSTEGEIQWERIQGKRVPHVLYAPRGMTWYSRPGTRSRWVVDTGSQQEWCGFRFRDILIVSPFLGLPTDPAEEWIASYWALVLPPTLISAYLILWPGKPSCRKLAR